VPARPGRPATQAWWSLTATSSDDPVRPAVPGVRAATDRDAADEPTRPVAVPSRSQDHKPAAPAPPAAAARVPRADRPGALPPARAVAGAAVAVAGVVLGIGTLLWATDAPAGDPALRPPADSAPPADEPAVALPEAEQAPVDPPPPVAEPPAAAPEAPPAPAPEPAPAEPAAPAFTPVPVLVLNNSRIEGLAERSAAYFEREGWPVREIGSSRGRIRATTIYYPPGQEAVAQEFARRFPGIKRVLPRLENLPGTGLTVVVTRDFDV